MMTSVEDERAIIHVINRYAYALDGADWKLFRTCWADEIDVDYGGLQHTSGDAITPHFEKVHTGLRTFHMLGNHYVEALGPDRAKARTYYNAKLFKPDGSLFVAASGWYNDELAKIGGEWKITKRRLHYHETQRPADQPAKEGAKADA